MTDFLSFIGVKIALAQGLVPNCSPTECGEEQLLQLGVNVINFMIQFLAFPLVVVFFLWGGFLLLTSGGSPNRVEQGKKAITGAIIGLVIVLTSVVVINTLLGTFTSCEVKLSQIGKVNCPGITD
ncbi:MAG: pilin [Candidatus Colwellbacteria bacterium]|nr:pilin [Candidatus Colwellbacteria bacterium]